MVSLSNGFFSNNLYEFIFPLYVLHSLPISSLLTWTLQLYLAKKIMPPLIVAIPERISQTDADLYRCCLVCPRYSVKVTVKLYNVSPSINFADLHQCTITHYTRVHYNRTRSCTERSGSLVTKYEKLDRTVWYKSSSGITFYSISTSSYMPASDNGVRWFLNWHRTC
jgi:hypothetical protein